VLTRLGVDAYVLRPCVTPHSPNEISLLKASWSDFCVVAPCCSKLARCLMNFAFVAELIDQIYVGRETFFI